jgi:hypothetical protein
MKYSVQMGSVAMKYKSSFIKTGTGIEKLIKGDTQRERERVEIA